MKHFCYTSNKVDLQKQAKGKRSQMLTYRTKNNAPYFTNKVDVISEPNRIIFWMSLLKTKDFVKIR